MATSKLTLLTTTYILFYFYAIQSRSKKPFIDEIFHVPQAQEYCRNNFHVWDDKITTLPGLYLFSYSLTRPFRAYFEYVGGDPGKSNLEICSLLNLRITSLFSLFILYFTIKGITGSKHKALLIITNPVLLLFSCLYYTDVLSATSLMLVYYLTKEYTYFSVNFLAKTHSKRHTFLLLFFCIFSVFCRQTNIVWLGFIAFENLYNSSNQQQVKFRDLVHGKFAPFTFENFKELFQQIISISSAFILTLIGFLVFVIFYNDFSLVVGDKSAHQPCFHGVQFLYCFLFIMIWNLPSFILDFLYSQVFLTDSNERFKSVKANFNKIFMLGCILPVFVHLTTTVHPYLLADNRHVTFYLWKNFLKHKSIQFCLIPIYIFALCQTKRLFRIPYYYPTFLIFLITIFISTVPQKLLEIRYFIVPNLFFQIYSKNLRIRLGLIYNFIISFGMLALFMVKDVYWADIEDVQMIIW